MKTSKPLQAYLTRSIKIKSPFTGTLIIFPPETFIRINIDTGVAWIKQYQTELERNQYELIH